MCPRAREAKDRPEKTPRIFYCPEAAPPRPDAGENERTLALSAEESHHALHALRLGPGDHVCLFDGKGRFFDAVIVEADRRRVSVRIDSCRESLAEPKTRLILLVALLKGRKSDLLIQKATELGVGEILFYPARRSVARFPSASEEGPSRRRWEKTVISACKQSRRATLMPVTIHASLEAALSVLPEGAARFVFWENLEPEALRSPAGSGGAGPPFPHGVCAMIGPEGGLTAEEMDLVRRAGFLPRSLGPRILRAETAALAAAAVLLHQAGELGDLRDPL